MRKLAREMVVFIWLGTIVIYVSTAIYLTLESRHKAMDAAMAAVSADGLVARALSSVWHVQVPLTTRRVLYVRQCPQLDNTRDWNVIDQVEAEEKMGASCRHFTDPFAQIIGARVVSIPLGHPEQIAIEKEFWNAYKAKKETQASSIAFDSLLGAFYGAPGGLCVWLLYRSARFAIKG